MSKNIKIVPTKDFEDVVATVAKYIEGLRVANVSSLTQAFHNDTVMYGFTNGELLGALSRTSTTLSRRMAPHPT